MVEFLKTLSSRLNAQVEYFLALSGIAMSLIVVLQVFFRYILNHSLFWSEELARYLLIWLTFFGASTAYYRGLHPGVDLLYSRVSDRWRWAARLMVHTASIALFGVMMVKGAEFAWFVRLQISPALSLPKWTVMAVIPLSGAVFMLHAVTFLLLHLLQLKISLNAKRSSNG